MSKILSDKPSLRYGTDNNFLGERIHLGNGRVLFTRPPLCVLIEKKHPKHPRFHNLPPELFPVLAEESHITFRARPNPSLKKQESFTVVRRQVPITPAFAITAHKTQGRTFSTAVLDLEKPLPPPPITEHQTFRSVYVMLSRLQTFAGLHLLRPISLNSIQSKPHAELLKHDYRLRQLEEKTIEKWTSLNRAVSL